MPRRVAANQVLEDNENSPLTALVTLLASTVTKTSIGPELRKLASLIASAPEKHRQIHVSNTGKDLTKWARKNLSRAAEKGSEEGQKGYIL